MRALVRPPSEAYARCLRSDAIRRIDVAAAREQHAAYVAALRACGLDVLELPPEPEMPDACFVEDTAVVVDGRVIITRPGAEARRAECDSVARALGPCRRLERGRLDGGDVLQVVGKIFVGLSARTDREGAEAVGGRPIPVGRFLHLKSAVTPIGPRALIQVRGAFEWDDLEVVETDEPAGGNVLWLGEHAIVSAAAPRTAELLRRRGLRVHVVDVSEFHAGDAGITCLSVVNS